MIVRSIYRYPSALSKEPLFKDHTLFTGTVTQPLPCSEHTTTLGIVSMLAGEGKFFVNSQPITLDQDTFLVLNSGSRLKFVDLPAGSIPLLLFFTPGAIPFMVESALLTKKLTVDEMVYDYRLMEYVHPAHRILKEHLRLLVELSESCASFYALKADMVILHLLDSLIQENQEAVRVAKNLRVVRHTTRIHLYKRLAMAKAWMEENYARPITVQQAASVAMMNEVHFLRTFRQAYTITPHQYLISVRLAHAKKQIEKSTEPIAVICRQVGFESASSFCGLFRAMYHHPPSYFRKRHYYPRTSSKQK